MSNENAIQSLQEKIDRLNKEAWDIRVNDSPKSLEISKESVELARAVNYQKGLAQGLQSLGFGYIRVSKYDEALPILNESLSLFESLNDLRGEAIVYEYLAVIKRNWGDFGLALEFLFKALALCQQNGFVENEGTDHYQIGVTYKYLGNFEKALDSLYKSLAIYRGTNDRLFQSYPINVIGSIYFENGDYNRALEYFQEALAYRQESGDKLGETGSLDNIGFTYFKLSDYPKAIDYCTRSLAISEITGDKRSQANALQHLAEIHTQAGDSEQAIKFCHESLELRKAIGDKRGEIEIRLFLAAVYTNQLRQKDNNKILEWLTGALILAEDLKAVDLLSKTHFHLYEFYKLRNEYEEALKHLHLHIDLEKEFHKNTINQKVLNLEISYRAEESRKEADAIRQRNDELTRLNREIEEQKKKLEEAITDLKATQAQLIQSEKMASLGELTAGIAHEIQNPLNFVNNFSEVNTELIDELQVEMDKGNLAGAGAIAKDIKENEEKINHHGKRADTIVKGMLQHSRSSSGVREPTDINALADEYLRLAYHGLRAKDKSFSAKIKTDFDAGIGNITVVPQDIGRVALNLITNAFYAVNEKKKQLGDKYEPTVTVCTKKAQGNAEITVIDNGYGIPQKVMDKIFQPFFTTKPTGQGTGLGLSLSYDIIKAHGGEINVATKEGEGTTFTVLLPSQ